jgi:hypothetical protein
VPRESRPLHGHLCALAAALLATLLSCRAGPSPAESGLLEAGSSYFQPFGKLWRRDELALCPELAEAIRYDLRLRVSEDLRQAVGELQLRFTNRQPQAILELPFLCYPSLTRGALRLTSVQVAGATVQPTWQADGALLVVPLHPALSSGTSTTVTFQYDLQIPEGRAGEANLFSLTGEVLSLAYPYPMLPAPRAWAHDLPAGYGDFTTNEASFYRVRVSVPEGVVVAAPGVELRRSREAGRAELLFVLGPARDLYLAASREFLTLEERRGDILVRSFFLPGQEEGGLLALDVAHAALEAFSRRFGPYPFTTLTVVSAPLRALGMEFPGIIVMASRLYGASGEAPGGPDRFAFEGTLAHEVAHQWFYGLVGNDQLLEPWIDESLAQYAFVLYYRDRYGEAARAQQELQDTWDAVQRARIPIGLPVREYTREQYGAIIYGRAPLFLQALSARLGEQRFELLLSELLQRHRWGLVDGGVFRLLAEELCRCDLGDLWAQWVYPVAAPTPAGAAR